jgi:hypothetical protein
VPGAIVDFAKVAALRDMWSASFSAGVLSRFHPLPMLGYVAQ